MATRPPKRLGRSDKTLRRRDVLVRLGSAAALVPLARVVEACGGHGRSGGPTGADSGAETSDSGMESDSETAMGEMDGALAGNADGRAPEGTDAAEGSDAGAESGGEARDASDAADGDAAAEAGAEAGDAGAWATGGTASMTGKASYPNPFASGVPATCPLTGALNQGPCWDSQAESLEDISYGQLGLPMRMGLQVLDSQCRPIAGALVDVWHVAPTGKYSGDDTTNENISFCTADDPAYTSTLWFRGKRLTDGAGVAWFDTCFPGWYPTRTLHVHVKITVGQSTLTTQLIFDDSLGDDIIGTQPIYKDRGARDSKNASDLVIAAGDYPQYLFQWQRMSDGAMLAWKTVVVA